MKVFDAALEAIRTHRTYTVITAAVSDVDETASCACHGCGWTGADLAAADIHVAEEIDLLVD